MSLLSVMVAGTLGGLLSILSSWLVTGMLFHRYQRLTPETWRPEGPKQYTLSSLVQILAGAAVGLLFFATGGASHLGVMGWLPGGLLFGGLVWLAVASPIHVISAVYVRLHRGVVVGLLLDTCGIADCQLCLRMGGALDTHHVIGPAAVSAGLQRQPPTHRSARTRSPSGLLPPRWGLAHRGDGPPPCGSPR